MAGPDRPEEAAEVEEAPTNLLDPVQGQGRQPRGGLDQRLQVRAALDNQGVVNRLGDHQRGVRLLGDSNRHGGQYQHQTGAEESDRSGHY